MLEEVERLHNAGNVSDSIYEAFRKGIPPQNDALRSRGDSGKGIPTSDGGASREDEARRGSSGDLESKAVPRELPRHRVRNLSIFLPVSNQAPGQSRRACQCAPRPLHSRSGTSELARSPPYLQAASARVRASRVAH